MTKLDDEALVANTNKVEQVVFKNGMCLLVKVLAERPYKKEAFKVTMKRAWRPIKPLVFRDLRNTIPLAEFTNPRDKAIVIRDGPGSFDKYIVLLMEVDDTEQTHEIKFEKDPFLDTFAQFTSHG